ncbi:MAG: hypothetical protein ACXAE3_03430 [Candidatus Kariarchaeaceae archaeon]|jgi:hypothetical protein
MDTTQRRIVPRLGLILVITLVFYIVIIGYLRNFIDGPGYFGVLAVFSLTYFLLLILLWVRERTLYFDYIMQRRIESGNAQYLLCPSCRVIQVKGTLQCSSCGDEWIVCQTCRVPFEPETKVLVSPCCGLGFHFDHFEAALRELGYCPVCKSDLPLNTANW